MADLLWTDANLDPKRAYRFKATFASNVSGFGTTNGQYYIKTVQKPGIEIAAKEHMYLGHKFFYPGIVTWNPNPIEIKMVDPVTPNCSKILASIVNRSGYVIPNSAESLTTMSKQKSTLNIGNFVITTLNADGTPIENWILKNAFIKSVKFGDLDYSKDDLTEVTIQLQYDWCEFVEGTSSAGVGGIFSPGTGG
jgi:hypothetical protein